VNTARPILVVGCGNEQRGDDAIGPLVVDALRALSLDDVETIDLADRPTDLIDHLVGREAVIVVDAMDWPGRPAGMLVDVDWRTVAGELALDAARASTHGMSVADQLRLAEQLGVLPGAVRLIGLTVDHVTPHEQVTEAIRARLPWAVRRVARRCAVWRHRLTPAAARR
jgi:hydrogenase maturation protease